MEKDTENLKEFSDYLLENYRRGIAGENYLPGLKEDVDPKKAVSMLEKLLPESSPLLPVLIKNLSEEVRQKRELFSKTQRSALAEKEIGDFLSR